MLSMNLLAGLRVNLAENLRPNFGRILNSSGVTTTPGGGGGGPETFNIIDENSNRIVDENGNALTFI